MLKSRYSDHGGYYTCCQHIRFRELIPYMKALGVTKLFTPHKVKGEDTISGVVIEGCPLYAVNFEDPYRNSEITSGDTPPRDLLYSFVGGYQNGYLSMVRNDIFNLPPRSDTLIRNTGSWHFNSIVYSSSQNAEGDQMVDTSHHTKTAFYNQTLQRSRYSLCPSGSGPNSIRLWESLAVGAIPVILADTLDVPACPLWEQAVIFLPERDVGTVADVLSSIQPLREAAMREKCLEIYKGFRNSYASFSV